MTMNNIDDFIVQWNSRFPMDRIWRQKYKVPFLSSTHRESSFISQLIDLREDLLFSSKQKEEETTEVYIPNIGDIFKSSHREKSNGLNEISDREIEDFREQSKMFE